MSNLVPTSIVDKNGKNTTVHKRADDGGKVSERVASAAPVSAAKAPPVEIPSYEWESTIEVKEYTSFFDVRDIESALTGYAEELENHLEEINHNAASTKDEAEELEAYGIDHSSADNVDAEHVFNEEDIEGFEAFKTETEQWGKYAEEVYSVSSAISEGPEGDNVQEWAQYAREVAAAWVEIGDNNGVTVVAEHYFDEYAEEFARETGAVSDNLPFYIQNNINWQEVGKDMLGQNGSFDMGATKFYLT